MAAGAGNGFSKQCAWGCRTRWNSEKRTCVTPVIFQMWQPLPLPSNDSDDSNVSTIITPSLAREIFTFPLFNKIRKKRERKKKERPPPPHYIIPPCSWCAGIQPRNVFFCFFLFSFFFSSSSSSSTTSSSSFFFLFCCCWCCLLFWWLQVVEWIPTWWHHGSKQSHHRSQLTRPQTWPNRRLTLQNHTKNQHISSQIFPLDSTSIDQEFLVDNFSVNC